MSLRLLLDENLSERLLLSLEDCYPDSNHVRQLGLGGATDRTIWSFAGQEGFVLVTKDEDFLDLSVSLGFPPRVVCLDIGNASNGRTAELFISGRPLIEDLIDHPEAGFLVLGSRGSGRAS
jgi:predicted nuclease of predicted toxin-antitoxin system